MKPYRADRVVRVLTAIVSVAYFAAWVGGVAALVVVPGVKAMALSPGHPAATGESNFTFGWSVLATLRDGEDTVQTAWGPMELVVEHADAELRFPIEVVPWGVFAIGWLVVAVGVGLVLLTLYHLRRIFQRVRDGAPFDAQNALRMRAVGLLLLAGAVYDAVLGLVISTTVRRGVETGEITVSRWIDLDGMGIFMALVVVALAEVFRRGAELEDEQSLVV